MIKKTQKKTYWRNRDYTENSKPKIYNDYNEGGITRRGSISWYKAKYSLYDLAPVAILSVVLLSLSYVLINEHAVLIKKIDTLNTAVVNLNTQHSALLDIIKEKEAKILYLESAITDIKYVTNSHTPQQAASDEMKKFYIKTAGVVVGVVALGYTLGVLKSYVSPFLYFPKILVGAFQYHIPYFNKQRVFTHIDDNSSLTWVVKLINDKQVDILLKTADSPEFVNASLVVQVLMDSANIVTANTRSIASMNNSMQVSETIDKLSAFLYIHKNEY